MAKTDRDFGSAPLAAPVAAPELARLLLPSGRLLLLRRPGPGARPRPSPVAGARASLGGGGLSRRRRPLVAGRGRPLVPGDGGTSCTILQRHFPREPRRSVMGSRGCYTNKNYHFYFYTKPYDKKYVKEVAAAKSIYTN
ncbi:unnamed protein product [Urochloa humidicola]